MFNQLINIKVQNVLSNSVNKYLCHKKKNLKSSLGAAGIVWFLCWMYVVYDTPEIHPRISTAERNYIQSSLVGQTKKTINTVTRISTLNIHNLFNQY